MNNRCWPWLLLSISVAVVPQRAAAQIMPSGVQRRANGPSKQSHHNLPNRFDLNDAQEMMAERLRELRELHQLQDQVQGLLSNPQFVKNIIKQHFSSEQLQQIQKNMLNGKELAQDHNLRQLLQQASSGQKLDQGKLDNLFRRLAEQTANKPPSESEASATGKSPSLALPAPTTPPSSAAAPSFPSAAMPHQSLLDRMEEKTTQWLMDHLDEVSDEALEALVKLGGNDEGAPVNEWLRAMKQADLSGGNLAEQAAGLSNYLPKLSDFLPDRRGIWEGVGSLFDEAQPPSLPSFGDSSSAVEDASGWMPAILCVLMLGVLVVFLCKWTAKSPAASEKETWRLGSWPVWPDSVSTRQDIIRAFEYLALLCLGPTAGTCHHRELAERLAEQDSGNSSRRQAVETLAWLYEQARYAPADESLSEGELSDARQALCLLAGVTAV